MTKNTSPGIYNDYCRNSSDPVCPVGRYRFFVKTRRYSAAELNCILLSDREVREFPVTYNVYADVVLANNFTIDFLLLTVVKKVMKLETRKGGILLASMAGAFYALAVTIFPFPVFFLQSIVTYFAASALMAALAFRIKDLNALIKAVAGLYLAAVMTAGLMELFRAGGFFGSIYLYAAAAGFSIFLTLSLWRTVSKSAADSGHLYSVLIEYQGRKAGFTGFLDTGNRLTEPYTGSPVSVISAESCGELFGTVNAVLFVPFRSVGKDSGILPAIRADRMEIEKEGQKKVIEKPYIAISEETLSQNGSYQILLNEKLWL